MKKIRGFTVVEMLITLVIVGFFIALTLRMGTQAVQRATLTSAVNDFMADLNYARQLSSRKNRYVAFEFYPDGTGYTMWVQKRVGDDPSIRGTTDINNPGSYGVEKISQPMGGEPCFRNTTDFAINSMGLILPYPVPPNSTPLTVRMEFFKARKGSDYADPEIVYKRDIIIFPTGGIKIESTGNQKQ